MNNESKIKRLSDIALSTKRCPEGKIFFTTRVICMKKTFIFLGFILICIQNLYLFAFPFETSKDGTTSIVLFGTGLVLIGLSLIATNKFIEKYFDKKT